MEALFVMVLIIAGMLMIYKTAKTLDEKKSLFETQQALDATMKNISYGVRRIANLHIRVLSAKRKQLCYLDDYGNEVDDQWRREVRYFLETVVERIILLSSEYEREYAVSEIIIHVIEYEISRLNSALSSQDPSDDYSPEMSGVHFEEMVGKIITDRGPCIRPTPSTGDQGVDIIASQAGVTVAIQCKRSSSPVGNKAVQEVSAGRLFYETDQAWVVSDASFTRSARQLASSLNVHLIDFRGIEEHIARAFG